MKQTRWGFLILGWAGLFSCGGRAIDDSDPDASESSSSAPSGPAKGNAGKSSSSDSLPSHKLGACKPGFDRAQNPTRPCHWLTDSGACFDSTESACACICPSDRDSVCAHGFDDGLNSQTPIYCF